MGPPPAVPEPQEGSRCTSGGGPKTVPSRDTAPRPATRPAEGTRWWQAGATTGEEGAAAAAASAAAAAAAAASAAASVAAAAAGEETQRREAAAKNHQSFVLLEEIFEMRLKFLHESA